MAVSEVASNSTGGRSGDYVRQLGRSSSAKHELRIPPQARTTLGLDLVFSDTLGPRTSDSEN